MNIKNENQSQSHKTIYAEMKKVFLQWALQEEVTNEELVNFLKSLKDAAIIEKLTELEMVATNKLVLVNKNSLMKLKKKQWQRYIAPLISLADKFSIDESEQDFILLVDDDVDFVTLTKHILEKEGYSVIVSPNGRRVLEMIYDFRPALILLELHLPDINGFTLLEQILDKAKKTRTPIAIMSADNSKENILRTYQLGAIDFMAKPIDSDILIAKIKNRLTHKQEIEKSIIIDELTNAYNRTYMNTQLEHFIYQFRRSEVPFTVVIIDLDHFKKVNDTYGHLTGDHVLRQFFSVSKKLKRDGDIFCRYGGEEFVLLLPDTLKEGAKQLVNRIQTALAKKVFSVNGAEFQVTFSAGIAEVTKGNLNSETILGEADQALYFAKESGRNLAAIYEPSMQVAKKRINITIIIVDDDALMRQILIDFFTTWDPSEEFEIGVQEFDNGISFLESDWYHADEKYMILLDGIMPKMEGMEVLKRVRKDYSSQNVLISMLTGLTGEKNVIRFLEMGADDYIEKPFVTEALAARIFRLMKRLFR